MRNNFMDDQQFSQLLNKLNLSWTGYRKVRKGVKKRIARHMHLLECKTMAAYFTELDRSDETRQECHCLMSVSISRFFRDRQLWQSLGNKMLPFLISKNKETIKVWSAGCACGEEAYSFRIVWNRLEKRFGHLPGLEITATDFNSDYLERARAGVYQSSSMREVDKDSRSICFETKKGGALFAVKSFLKKNITWKKHHLLSDPPGQNFDIIFLRNNLLTYYQDQLKKPAFKNVIDALSPSGIIVIGSHEVLPFETDNLIHITPFSYVFRKHR